MEQFEDIRAFEDKDVAQALKELLNEPIFLRLLNVAFPGAQLDDIQKQAKTVEDVQVNFVINYLDRMLKNSSDGLSYSGIENISKDHAHFYISNHRDIILDSALLNYLLVKNGFSTTEIAIGDNLLILPWIKTLVRLNKSFIVKRNLPVKQMIVETQKLSSYIRHTILEKKNSIWIAQREGRAKDSDDRTSGALLKMINMGGDTSFSECLSKMNITPLSIAYEYDPCDYLKAREFLLKRLDPEHKKSPADDMLNMRTGIEGYKGHIHFHIAPQLTENLEKLQGITNKNEQVTAAAELIDQTIHLNYKFFPNNFVAHDLLYNKIQFVDYYTKEEETTFKSYLKTQIERIAEHPGNEAFLQKTLLTMYANPLSNHIVAHQPKA